MCIKMQNVQCKLLNYHPYWQQWISLCVRVIQETVNVSGLFCILGSTRREKLQQVVFRVSRDFLPNSFLTPRLNKSWMGGGLLGQIKHMCLFPDGVMFTSGPG